VGGICCVGNYQRQGKKKMKLRKSRGLLVLYYFKPVCEEKKKKEGAVNPEFPTGPRPRHGKKKGRIGPSPLSATTFVGERKKKGND